MDERIAAFTERLLEMPAPTGEIDVCWINESGQMERQCWEKVKSGTSLRIRVRLPDPGWMELFDELKEDRQTCS